MDNKSHLNPRNRNLYLPKIKTTQIKRNKEMSIFSLVSKIQIK